MEELEAIEKLSEVSAQIHSESELLMAHGGEAGWCSKFEVTQACIAIQGF